MVGSAVGKPIHKPKIDFYYPFSLYISDLYGVHKVGLYLVTVPYDWFWLP